MDFHNYIYNISINYIILMKSKLIYIYREEQIKPNLLSGIKTVSTIWRF